ncbi:unnamed protein product [Penicillium roqueforti FM164]|uniref:Genomic scaffold, ProqFM164S02 n=1 Tax=Penicillium roqueforti (strain FM164) TaxID=1365484 RepID=W6Q7T1_PENRF|nr:unnamed protein product [Penicillium roqueforti FM164]
MESDHFAEPLDEVLQKNAFGPLSHRSTSTDTRPSTNGSDKDGI